MQINLKNQYRTELDGLRGVAVIAVIINHFNNKLLSSGYLGVDIFFVISGYVITSSLARRKSKDFWDYILSFYKRRIKRLIPALVFFIIPLSLLICFFNPDPRLSLRTGITSLFGLSNLYLLKQSTDYFGELTDLNVFTHTWSLGVEEQFYFIFPLIAWFTGFSSKAKKGSRNLFIIISIFSIFSFSSFIYLYQINESFAYFLMPTRFWEIAIGSLIFLTANKKSPFLDNLKKISPNYLFFGILFIFLLPENIGFYSNIFIVLFTSLLIFNIQKGFFIYNFLNRKEIVNIGLLSYSLYLWHWGILSISRWTIGIHWWSFPLQIYLIYALSKISYKFIEKPLRNKNWSFQNLFTIIKGIITLILTGLTFLIIDTKFEGKFFLGNKNFKNDYSWRKNITSATKEITGKKCHGDPNYSEDQKNYILNNCIIINHQNKGKKIAFIGDSHILAMINSQRLLYEKGFDIIHKSFSSCPFPYPKNGLKRKDCDKFNSQASQLILNKLGKDDFIIINNYHLSHLGDKSLRDVRHEFYDEQGRLPSNGNEKSKIYIKSLINFSEKAKSKKIKIILIGATMRNNLLQISSKEWFRFFPSNEWVYKDERINANNLNNNLKEGIKNIDNIIFIDPIKEMNCCINNEEFNKNFRDTDHLSTFGSDILIKKIIKIIDN